MAMATTQAARPFHRVLVANRGEIAVRVLRAAHDADLTGIAIYAEQDRDSLFVSLADEAYSLNGSSAKDTYLNIDRILDIAKQCHAEAIHPGYGFLSESDEFAQRVIDAGLVWIGPSPQAIATLGNKVAARHIATLVGAPLAPGTVDPVTSVEEIEDFARTAGMPIAIKAAFGGGGKGLKIAHRFDEIPEAFESATREAIASFGRGECFVEKYLDHPRHVETQCLADMYGDVTIISTRDCSLQRRNQKLVEEAPAPFLSDEQHRLLVESSKALLHEAGYVGAGTCEFLLSTDGTISFLEVNTRLQVEHTVSEEVTGIDLVCEQFRIAAGGHVPDTDATAHGHAFEFRINAEDPAHDFMPQTGTITRYHEPGGPGVRVDSGVEEGDSVAPAFDSLLAKLVVTGPTRAVALARARRALAEYTIDGITTVLPFHRAIVNEPAFIGSEQGFSVYTRWIENDFANTLKSSDDATVQLAQPAKQSTELHTAIIELNGRRVSLRFPEGFLDNAITSGMQTVASAASPAPTRYRQQSANNSGGPAALAHNPGDVLAPMGGTVVKESVHVSDVVHEGDSLLVIESMKMEQIVRAPHAGTVTAMLVKFGDTFATGQPLLTIK
jgi:acetyl-CoA/propionyl-CoA carboxylase biotin carboxyl carrier protein